MYEKKLLFAIDIYNTLTGECQTIYNIEETNLVHLMHFIFTYNFIVTDILIYEKTSEMHVYISNFLQDTSEENLNVDMLTELLDQLSLKI